MIRFKTCCKALAASVSLMLVASCSAPKNIVYVQDLKGGEEIILDNVKGTTARPGDELKIVVSSRNPELAAMFNLPVLSSYSARETRGQTGQIATYTVDSNGDIMFPVLGLINVDGMTRRQISDYIANELITRHLLDDPIVTVDFVNVFFSVAGEVNHPGRYELTRENMTLLDALSAAGDMTIYGERPTVKVIRRAGDTQQVYNIDLTNSQDMMKSPGYLIQQEDVVYVAPNNARKRQATVNGNNLLNYSFWLSLASVLTSMAVLIFK